ncbi:MAG: zinc ribbon domain-containing protein [Candidatus Hydrogenedentota bacterium]
MPIYEYVCPDCGHKWSDLVNSYKSPDPACPECASIRGEKLFSVFARSAESSAGVPQGMPAGGCGPHNCGCGKYN